MTNTTDKQLIETAIETFKMAEEMICFTYQVSDAIITGEKVKAKDLRQIKIGNIHITTHWKKYPEFVKKHAEKIPFFCQSYCIILCKESYTTLVNKNIIAYAEEKDNKNLYNAENILKIMRHTYSHIDIFPNKKAQPTYYKIDNKDKRIFEVKINNENQTINIILDTRNKKDDDLFYITDIGGLVKLFYLLRYLKHNLENKITQLNKEH